MPDLHEAVDKQHAQQPQQPVSGPSSPTQPRQSQPSRRDSRLALRRHSDEAEHTQKYKLMKRPTPPPASLRASEETRRRIRRAASQPNLARTAISPQTEPAARELRGPSDIDRQAKETLLRSRSLVRLGGRSAAASQETLNFVPAAGRTRPSLTDRNLLRSQSLVWLSSGYAAPSLSQETFSPTTGRARRGLTDRRPSSPPLSRKSVARFSFPSVTADTSVLDATAGDRERRQGRRKKSSTSPSHISRSSEPATVSAESRPAAGRSHGRRASLPVQVSASVHSNPSNAAIDSNNNSDVRHAASREILSARRSLAPPGIGLTPEPGVRRSSLAKTGRVLPRTPGSRAALSSKSSPAMVVGVAEREGLGTLAMAPPAEAEVTPSYPESPAESVLNRLKAARSSEERVALAAASRGLLPLLTGYKGGADAALSTAMDNVPDPS